MGVTVGNLLAAGVCALVPMLPKENLLAWGWRILCELGPPEYAMTGRDGYELSDRWQEAQLLKEMVRALWQRPEAEALA